MMKKSTQRVLFVVCFLLCCLFDSNCYCNNTTGRSLISWGTLVASRVPHAPSQPDLL